MTATIVECPKCFGTGVMRHFRQVQDGICFLCSGAKAVTQAQAGRWLAAQMGASGGGALETSTRQDTPESRATGRAVKLEGRGTCWIRRCGPDAYGAFSVSIPSEVGELPAWFDVRGGRVVVTESCDGLRGEWAEIEAALQKAYRG